jgi:hypothetical protein
MIGGKIAGVNVTATVVRRGAGATIRIRGRLVIDCQQRPVDS